MKKPNILFIMADQMRHDALECNGNAIIQTPNYNRLAEMGINFSNSYSPDPICVPARASITTGFYSNKCTGRKDNDGIIKEGFPLLGDELNKRGYETYAMGKLHYESYAPPGEKKNTHGITTVEFAESGRIIEQYDPQYKLRGLEEYNDYLETVGWGGYSRGDGMGNNDVYPATSPIPEEHYVDTWVADRAIYHMNKHLEGKTDKPFFMWASFPKPHSAFNPPKPYDSMYDPRMIKSGQYQAELVGLQDIMPTLLSLIGEPLDKKVDGIDLWSVISGQSEGREFYVSQCNDNPNQRYMIANKEWKYIYQQRNGVEELYNQLNDPHELVNLADSEKQEFIDVKNILKDQLTKWCMGNDAGMIDNGTLIKTSASKEVVLPERNESFGRRYY